MEIRELSIDLIGDWFDFFENRAFADHDDWNGCFCTAFFYPKPEEYTGKSTRKRDFARWLVEEGRMKGYMAYEEGRVVGWVNANSKKFFPRVHGAPERDEKILSIVCFIVQKEHRRKGIAQSLLQRIIRDSSDRGYSIIEAYPKKRAKSEFGSWNGPYEMYLNNGFHDEEINTMHVVRKILK